MAAEHRRTVVSRQRGSALLASVLALSLGLAHGRFAHAQGGGEQDGYDDSERDDEGYEGDAEPEPEPYYETGESSESGGEAPSGRRGISPRWFWASLAVGLGLGVGAAITGGYALSLNAQYLEDPADPLLRERGVSLQLATNVLLGAAGGVAAVALLLGIFTDWSSLRPDRDEPDDDAMFTYLGGPLRAVDSDQLLAQRLGHCCRP